jgi:hypothetical protein
VDNQIPYASEIKRFHDNFWLTSELKEAEIQIAEYFDWTFEFQTFFEYLQYFVNIGVLFGNDCVMSGSAVSQRVAPVGGKDYLMVRDASKESFVLGVNAGKFSFLTPEERHDKKKTSFNSDFSKEIYGTKDEVAKMAGEKDISDAANGHVKPAQRSSSNLMDPLTVEGEGSLYDVNIYNLNGLQDKKNFSNRNSMLGSIRNISQDVPTTKDQSNLSARVTTIGEKTLPGREKSSNVSSMCHNNRKLVNESSTIDSSG